MNKFKTLAAKIGSNRYFLIIVSILLALALWLFIVIDANEDTERTISNIKINYIENPTLLDEEHNLIITDMSGIIEKTATVRISGKANIINKIDPEDISVMTDLSLITGSGDIPVTTYIDNPLNGVSYSALSPATVTVAVERIISKTIPVTSVFGDSYSIDKDFMGEPLILTPSAIVVRGSSSKVSKIEYATVTIDDSGVKETLNKDIEPIYYNADDEVVDLSGISSNVNTINVELQIKMLKEINLQVTLTPGGGATTNNATTTITPSTIQLKGEASQLEAFNNFLVIGNIDLASIETNQTTRSFSITDLIPEGVEIATGEDSVNVTVSLTGLTTRIYNAYNITTINSEAGYSALIIPNSIIIKVRGPASEFAGFEESNILITCDISSIAKNPGTHSLGAENISVTILGNSSLGAIKSYEGIPIQITKDE